MKYQFQSNPGQLSYKPSLFTDAIKILISVNFTVFILQSISSSEIIFFSNFGLVPKLVWSQLKIWQPFTYMFFHGKTIFFAGSSLSNLALILLDFGCHFALIFCVKSGKILYKSNPRRY